MAALHERTFTDEEVTRACDLHIDNIRRLIGWRAVIPVQAGGGRGRVRLWVFDHVARIAVTAAIFNYGGVSLRLAHTIAYALPYYALFRVFHVVVCGAGPEPGGYHGWLDPDNRRPAPEADDWLIDIINRRYVLCRWGLEDRDPLCFGLLDEDAGEFLSTVDLVHDWTRTETVPWAPTGDGRRRPDLVVKSTRARWEEPYDWWACTDSASLAYRHIRDIDQDAVRAAAASPLSKLTINISLAFRLAARRVLGLPVDYPTGQHDDAAPMEHGAASRASLRGASPDEAPITRPERPQNEAEGQPGACGSRPLRHPDPPQHPQETQDGQRKRAPRRGAA